MSAINTLRGGAQPALQIAEFPDVAGVGGSLALAANEDAEGSSRGQQATARGRPGARGKDVSDVERWLSRWAPLASVPAVRAAPRVAANQPEPSLAAA